MKQERWDSKTRTKILLEGLSADQFQRYVMSIASIKTNITAGVINSYPKLTESLNPKKTLEK